MTSDTAALYGLGDRGVLAPGKKGDLNVIDLERLENQLPEMVADLPAGDYDLQALLHVYETFEVAHGHTLKLPMDRGEGQQWSRDEGSERVSRADPVLDQIVHDRPVEDRIQDR